MKADRVLLIVCFALLITAVGCSGNFNTTAQAPNPGPGTPSAPTPTPTATPTPTPGATPTPIPIPTPTPSPSPTDFLYAIENPNAGAIVEAFGINSPQHHTAELPGIDLLLRDPATGMLTDTKRQFPSTCCDAFTDLAFALGGKYLVGVQNRHIAVSNNNAVTLLAVNPVTGDLTVASELRGDFSDMTVDRTGKFAILTNTTGTVVSYRVNADGTLTPAGSATAVAGVDNVVVDATNKFVYIQSSTTPQIFAFTFDESSGALGSVPESPFTTDAIPIRMASVSR